jgi:signal transduction histidine kinase
MFKLLRYFSIASLFAFLIVTVLLGFFYRSTAVEGLVAQEESKNVAVTKAFVNSLRPQLIAYLTLTPGLNADELRAHPALETLRRSVALEVAELPVAKIKIYNIDGITVFSTELRQIGEDQHGNDGFMVASAGGVVSELTHRNTFNTFDRVLEDQDVLSTYFPVRMDGPATSIVGVFELYSNVTPLLDRINSTQRNIVIGVALILAVLYAILFLVVRHADKIIRHQYMEQIQAEEKLSQQQRMLAILQERESLARELHDSVGQVLGYLNTQAQAVSVLWTQGQMHEAFQHLQRLVEVVQHVQVNVREQIESLHRGTTHRLSFLAALEQFLAEFRQECQISVELVHVEKWRSSNIDPDIETQLLSIVQEALTNVRKHALAQHAWVMLDLRDDQAVITIADDGKGFALDQIPNINGRHFGLQIMQDRTQEIGGRFEVQSAPGWGTQVKVKVPLPQARTDRSANHEGTTGG